MLLEMFRLQKYEKNMKVLNNQAKTKYASSML